MDKMDVDDLLKRIAGQRDQSALEQLYRQTSPKLMGLTLRILKDEAECADLLQELYLKVWLQADRYRGTGSGWGWLCVMARNAALDRLKTYYRRNVELSHDIQPLLDEVTITKITEANDSELDFQGLDRCMGKLQHAQREMILLSYIHGYSHHELQAKMGHPLGTIKSWIRRGLKELKLCLAS